MMTNMLIDLSSSVQATEDHQREKVTSPAASPSAPFPSIRRATRCHPAPTQERGLPDRGGETEEAKRLRELPIITTPTTDNDTTSEEDQMAPQHR